MKFTGFAVVAAAVLALGLTASDASAQMQMKKVKIATEGAYAPWNFVNSQGKLEGFELELGADLCKRAHLDCEFVAQDWDGIMPSLLAKKYDAIMAGMNITPKRMETINFTQAYAAGAHGFMVLKTSPLAKLPGGEYNLTKDPAAAEKAIADLKPMLKGKILGVQGSTTNLAWAEKYFKDVAEIREYKTTEQHDLDLAAGRIDATVGAHSAAKATMETATGKDMMIAGPGFSGGMLGLGVAVGVRKRLSEKWFKVDMTPKS
jgi:octopine/nopaline transport system substrate-binding protein